MLLQAAVCIRVEAMRSKLIVPALLAAAPWLALGCAGPESAGGARARARSPEAAAVAPAAPATSVAGSASGVSETPERDPAARGRGLPLIAADLPDDRDGDGVDQLELCPELPPERVDGCPHAR